MAIVCEYAGDDHKEAVNRLMKLYGFKPVYDNLFESLTVREQTLSRLKRDLDKTTDSFGAFRFYQYPLENTLAITNLTKKKWKRILLKPLEGE
ncbi:MAG: CRISPR-associated protein Cas2 [Spirochaetales bacterium]|nr:CRISPR-associated protein Cas2 [Spirochaetales bacterium]